MSRFGNFRDKFIQFMQSLEVLHEKCLLQNSFLAVKFEEPK